MRYLADTNILLRGVQKSHQLHGIVSRAVRQLLDESEELCVTSQNLIEFWAVATRPLASNGLELTVAEAAREVEALKVAFTLLPDAPNAFCEWESVVLKHQVKGKQAHDARLVAAMMAHNITHLLTPNVDDFKRYSEIMVIKPEDIV